VQLFHRRITSIELGDLIHKNVPFYNGEVAICFANKTGFGVRPFRVSEMNALKVVREIDLVFETLGEIIIPTVEHFVSFRNIVNKLVPVLDRFTYNFRRTEYFVTPY
jgi:hypothetical protein